MRDSPPARIHAALFDVDGTLVDTNDLHAAAWQQAFGRFGRDVGFDTVRFQIGKGGDNLIPALFPDMSESEREEIEAWRSDLFKRDYLPRAQPFPGVRMLFERLHADAIRIVLASSSGADEVDFHVGLIGAADLIAATTSKDDVESSKPCPDIFETAMAKAGPYARHEMIVVGDTPWDAKAAGKAGLGAIGFRCGGFSDEALRAAGMSALFDGPADLLRRYDSSVFANG